MSNTSTATMTPSEQHVAAAQPSVACYRRLDARSKAAPLTAHQHRIAELLYARISNDLYNAAATSENEAEYRRWRWCADKVRETGERHALWADLADYWDYLRQGVAQ